MQGHQSYDPREDALAPTIRLGESGARHLYAVEVEAGGKSQTIEVDANNRDQASRIARRAGYVVCLVNLIG